MNQQIRELTASRLSGFDISCREDVAVMANNRNSVALIGVASLSCGASKGGRSCKEVNNKGTETVKVCSFAGFFPILFRRCVINPYILFSLVIRCN